MTNLILKLAENKIFNRTIKGIVLLNLASTLGLFIYLYSKNKETENLYRQTLFKYADYNKDGFISSVEKSNFDSQLFKGKHVYFEGDELRYINGNSVHFNEMIQWINDYNKIK